MENDPTWRGVEARMILGLDCSTAATGYALLRDSKTYIEHGHITPNGRKLKGLDAARSMGMQVEALIADFPDITVVGMEGAFMDKRPHAAIVLGEVRGACALACGQRPVRTFPPASWRKRALGNGRISKPDGAALLARIFGLNNVTAPWDRWDALGVALACALEYC